jgi:molybdate transport system substrate-binding protein
VIRRGSTLAIGLAIAGLGLAGCSSSKDPAGSDTVTSASATADPVTGDITVFAAASLQGTFTDIGQQFEGAHKGTKVTFSFGGSSDLATSIDNDAPGDVFASASTKTMATVVAANHAADAVDIAQNVMEIVTPFGNPKKITSVADLAKSDVKVVICKVGVPCGDAATAVFKTANVTVTPVSLEADVKSTLAKVQSDEADAGIVYVTDVKAAGAKVTGVAIPGAQNFTTKYPMAVLKQTKNPVTARAFLDYVKGSAGQSVLSAAGFLRP